MPVQSLIKNKYLITLFIILVAYFIYWATDYIYGHYFNPAPPVVEILEESASESGLYEAAENRLFTTRSEKIQPEIFQIPGFTKIDLGRAKITSIPSEISGMQDLQILIAGGNRIREIPSEIGDLFNLRILILNDNKLEDLPFELGNLQNLEVLDLRNNRLTSLPDSIYSLQNLKRLSLGGNSIPQSQIQELSLFLPNTLINY